MMDDGWMSQNISRLWSFCASQVAQPSALLPDYAQLIEVLVDILSRLLPYFCAHRFCINPEHRGHSPNEERKYKRRSGPFGLRCPPTGTGTKHGIGTTKKATGPFHCHNQVSGQNVYSILCFPDTLPLYYSHRFSGSAAVFILLAPPPAIRQKHLHPPGTNKCNIYKPAVGIM